MSRGRKRFNYLVLILSPAVALAAAAFGPAWGLESGRFVDWHETMSPHFRALHQKTFCPPGFVLRLESVHGRLSMDLGRFSPWMARERITLYLYANQKAYLAGQFQPPAWSNGLAYYDRKILVIPEQPDQKKLMEITAHEMTHLLFESYWGQSRKDPPHWLNEGLAMMEESQANDGRQSEWHEAMGLLSADQSIPFPKLMETVPGELKDQDVVSVWYVEAYSLVYFLYHEHGRIPALFNFCQKLRDGSSVSDALWTVYRFQSVEKLQAAWADWLKLPRSGPKIARTERLKAQPKTRGFGDFTFHSFRERN